MTVKLPDLIVLKQVVVANELKRTYLKLLAYQDHADTLGKALNTAEVKLTKAKDELT